MTAAIEIVGEAVVLVYYIGGSKAVSWSQVSGGPLHSGVMVWRERDVVRKLMQLQICGGSTTLSIFGLALLLQIAQYGVWRH